jgi:DNA-binding phage protein
MPDQDPIDELVRALWRIKGERTISTMAREAGMEVVTLWRIMKGQLRPSADSVIALTRTFPELVSVFVSAGDPDTVEDD